MDVRRHGGADHRAFSQLHPHDGEADPPCRKLTTTDPPCRLAPDRARASRKKLACFFALERWKHVRCVQLDNMDRLMCNIALFGQVMTLTWGQLFKMTFQCQQIGSSFDGSRREEHDAGKKNAVALLSQKLLPKKKKHFRENGYFLLFFF